MQIFAREMTQRKTFMAGTHRTRSPAETVADYARFMPRMGITRLANVTGLDRIGLPVYLAIRPNARGLSGAQGKGEDADAAKASALMEAIETWHAERIERPLRYQSYLELREQVDVFDPSELPRQAGTVLRFDVPLLWIEGWDLLRERATWIPYETVHTNFVVRPGPPPVFLESTNGLASGNHLLEAVSHGLCEVIERDAVTLSRLWSEAARKQRQLDLRSVTDPACVRTLQLLARAGMFVAAWDATTDLAIPTYTCTILEPLDRPRWRSAGAFAGHGCHVSPAVALMRALSEAVQSRLTSISGSRDDILRRDYLANSNEDDQRRQLAAFSTPPPALDFVARGSLATETFEGDLATLLAALQGVGIQSAVVVDLGKPEIGIPVVKVVVPGLEAFHTPVYVPGKRAAAAHRRDRDRR
jgi:ribosomal protein S12 methylthiotransferase accessory factor